MSEFAVVLKIKVTVEETKDKIGIREGSHCEPGNRSPVSNLLIIYRSGNDRASNCVSEGIHEFMITLNAAFFTTGSVGTGKTVLFLSGREMSKW